MGAVVGGMSGFYLYESAKLPASALSVIVPATGQAVLYQQLLLEANQTQVIEVDARRRLRR